MLPLAAFSLVAPILLGLSQQSRFVQVPVEPRPSVTVESPAGVEYSIHDGFLERSGVRLDCTTEQGTGVARSLGVHLGGTVFVAAAEGLFRVSDEVMHTDFVKPSDGAPPGSPLGVVPRGLNRLWIATRDSFACLDSRQFFGRTFDASDGVPPGPYLGLTRGLGGLLLETEAGVFRYDPTLGERPVLHLTRVAEQEYEEGRVYPIESNGSVALTLEGDALGGASFRYRELRHHLWYALDLENPRITDLEPGRHTLLVTAWDRDLRRSLPGRIEVDVAYPKAFDKRVLMPIAVGSCLLVLCAWLFLARAMGGGRTRYGKAFVSAFMSCVVGLQLIAGAIPHARSWPFVGYTMYTEHYGPQGVTFKQTLFGLDRTGKRHQIEPYNAGYGLLEFRRDLAPLIHGNREVRDQFLETLNSRYGGRPFKGFLVLDERHRLTASGPIRVAATPLCVHPRKVLLGR